MPYIIAVLAFVVIGVGFTLTQSRNTNEPETISLNSIIEEVRETASSTLPNYSVTNTPDQEIDVVSKNEDLRDDITTPPQTPPPQTQPAPATPASPTPIPVTPNNTYTNGTFQTSNTYRTPDGTYTMNVSITLVNDHITGSTLSFDSSGARDGYSKRFSSAIESNIIGKDLETTNLSRVGGASLTTKAFNSALNTIRSQAS